MDQSTNQYGFVSDDEMHKWESRFPIGKHVMYMGKTWIISENREHWHTSDEGKKFYRRILFITRINKDDFTDAVEISSQRLAEYMVSPIDTPITSTSARRR